MTEISSSNNSFEPTGPPGSPPNDPPASISIYKVIANGALGIIKKTLEIAKEIFESKLIRFTSTLALGATLFTGAIASFSICCIPLFGLSVPILSCIIFTVACIFFVFARTQQTGERKDYFYAEYQQFLNLFRQTNRALPTDEVVKKLDNPGTCDTSKDYYSPICYLDSENKDPKKILIQSAQPVKSDRHDELFKNNHGVSLVINLTKEEEAIENIWSKPVQESDWETQGIEFVCIPVEDYSDPSVDNMEEGIKVIKEHKALDGSGSIAVHCMSGIGRSTVIVMAYLLDIHPDWTIGKAKGFLKGQRDIAGIDKKARNPLYLNFLIKTRLGRHTLDKELQERKAELEDEGMSDEKIKKQILKEYAGIVNLKEACESLFSD